MPLTFIANSNNCIIKLTKHGNNPLNTNIQYKLNNQSTWQEYLINQEITLNNPGDKVQFQNLTNYFSSDSNNYFQFSLSGNILADGNMQSLLNYSDTCPAYCFYKLFNHCETLLSAPQLPATKLNSHCYYQMFKSCYKLIDCPELPATKLADYCYSYMFQRCISLIRTPKLLATELAPYCYSYMFQLCDNLLKCQELPATQLKYACYRDMFQDCKRFIYMPDLPAIKLANYCYANMFNGCLSLTDIKQLPAINLAEDCYNGMFKNCINIINAPDLPAVSLIRYCYYHMFKDCSKLSTIKIYATDWGIDNCTTNWLQNVNTNGTFYCKSNLVLNIGSSYIPQNWSITKF